MNAILSIKPQFVEEIIKGRKRYEFRKHGFKEPVHTIYIYASSPVCRIIGEFVLGDIIYGAPENIWGLTNSAAGITKEYYEEYYHNKEIAYALEIKSFKKYDTPINPYLRQKRFTPPQSFRYIDNIQDL